MLDTENHVELNGVKYRLAEDAEGSHYDKQQQPLRPPNAVTVQGEASQKFQMRPDVLLWNLTDWSGGEGQLVWDAKTPNRHWELNRVDPFTKPGLLLPGGYIERTVDYLASDLNISATFAKGAGGRFFAIDQNSTNMYEWDDTNQQWGSTVHANAGASSGASHHATGDEDAIYYKERSVAKIWKFDGATDLFSTIATATISTSDVVHLSQSGPYVYVYYPDLAEVYEVAKSGSGVTLIDDFTEAGADPNEGDLLCAGDGKLYAAVPARGYTAIREITPSSAAGTGFGAEILRIPGLECSAIWYHSGTLFILGKYREKSTLETSVFYYIPGGSYGTLGKIRPGTTSASSLTGDELASRMLDHAWAVGNGVGRWDVYVADIISGGVACYASTENVSPTISDDPRSMASHDGYFFVSTGQAATGKGCLIVFRDEYAVTSYFTSPWHDFDLTDEKLFTSVGISCSALPADWSIKVEYAIDGSDTWTTATTYSTTSGTGTKVYVSTDASSVAFRTLRLKVSMIYGGGATGPVTRPELKGVEVRAQVAKPQTVWNLLLDLADDHTARSSEEGYDKIQNLETAGGTESVVDFKDGYQSQEPNVYTQHDVIVDQYRIILERPGEGVAAVVLREIA